MNHTTRKAYHRAHAVLEEPVESHRYDDTAAKLKGSDLIVTPSSTYLVVHEFLPESKISS